MNIDELKQILDIIREHGISEFELEREDVKLRIRKDGTRFLSNVAPPDIPAAAAAPAPSPAPAVGELQN